MVNPFTNGSWREMSPWKLFLLGFVSLVGVAIVLSVVKTLLPQQYTGNMVATDSYRMSSDTGAGIAEMAPYAPVPSSAPSYKSYDGDMSEEQATEPSVGADAESYESLSYYGSFKEGNLDGVCDSIESWKPLAYVVFEKAVRNDLYCNYQFKVERAHVASMVTEIENLNPEEFSAATETIKKQVVEYEGQLDILLRKQELLEIALTDAVAAYDDLRTLATAVEDVESLTKIIDSKLNTIERLTRERVNLSQQIDAIARQRAELADMIDYVYFSLRVEKYQMVDIASLKDSWVHNIRSSIANLNTTLQDLTLGVLVLLLGLVQLIIYAGIILVVVLVVAKFAWHHVRRFWEEGTFQK
ncbi:TPA: hypothetical protein DEP58_00695 [Patescibacteria group bacterium]|nr:MAG: hypothetical protein UU98_C0025G0008 [Parcubacteria group bacterium GW2011_GWD2_42_14]HCC04807.1 hypothetical protein [Patescibacteria group bacterium]